MGGPGSGGQNKIARDDLLRALADLRDELGETPRLKDWREEGHYSAKALYNEFDSWNAALDELDMEKHHVVNKERLTFECENPECDEPVEKTPTAAADSDRHYCSQDCHYEHKRIRYSGTGNPVSTLQPVECESCGDSTLRPQWKREENDRHYCSDCWGSAKVTFECEWCGERESVWPSVADERRWCSYECMGEWRSENITGEDHPRWREDYDSPYYYGPNFARQRRKAIIRDQGRCQDKECERTIAQTIRQDGEELSCHHKQPFATFVDENGTADYEAANRLENLVMLCRSCHGTR